MNLKGSQSHYTFELPIKHQPQKQHISINLFQQALQQYFKHFLQTNTNNKVPFTPQFQLKSIKVTNSIMLKHTATLSMNHTHGTDQFHSKCVCQICTCHKHKCPHSKLNIPFSQITSYQKEFVPHPLNGTQKLSTDNPKYLQTSYGPISSAYQSDYPGHKPHMRAKMAPRVKDERKDIPFDGESWYKSTYKPKSVAKDPLRNKDKQFNPCMQPFDGSTTYKTDFFSKRPQSQFKKQPNDVSYPDGYKFNGNTTYTNDFKQKPLNPAKSLKPAEYIGDKGKHFLGTTYRDDFNQKKPIEICPVLTLPQYPAEVSYPSQHVSFDKRSGAWQAK